jgi:hypothetical protein
MFWLEAFRSHFKVVFAQSTILAGGGGNATAARVDSQANLGAWLASRLLPERPLDARLTGKRLRSLRFETEARKREIHVRKSSLFADQTLGNRCLGVKHKIPRSSSVGFQRQSGLGTVHVFCGGFFLSQVSLKL